MTEERQQARQATIEELSAFIDSSHRQLDELLTQLQWSKEDIVNQQTEDEKQMRMCPVNSNHLVPETSLEQHVQECQLVAEGYSRQEQKEIRSTQFFYERSSSVVPVSIDKEAQQQILARVSGSSVDKDVPRTVDRMDKVFTSAEKLAIHDAVVERSKTARKEGAVSLQELEFDPEALLKNDEGANKPKSRLEILAEMRDYKRRRQSYRAKNVHITRRSQTEIMREIIEAQMSEIQQALQGDEGSVKSSEQSEHSASQGRSRSRDVSRSPIRSRSRRDDSRDEYRRERGRSKRSSYEGEANYPIRYDNSRSRDSSQSPEPSHSRQDRDRNRHGHYGYSRDTRSQRIKVEKDEQSGSREASSSPRRSGLRRVEDQDGEGSRPPSPQVSEAPRIKVEKEEDSGDQSPSRTTGEEREENGSSRHHHSKHKHRHKHKHHRRDSR